MVNSKLLFESLDNETFKRLEVDEIKERLKPLMHGLVVQAPIISQGSYLYRGRELGPTFNKKNGIRKKDLIYPPSALATPNRANIKGRPMFYCSLSKEPIFFELPSLTHGSELIVSFWKTKENLIVNNIGYTQYTFEKLGAKRICPMWTSKKDSQFSNQEEINLVNSSIPDALKNLAYSKDENRMIREAMGNAFMSHVDSENKYMYKLSAALAELHLGKIAIYPYKFAGILYPSIRMDAEGDNLALLPEVADSLEFKKAVHIRIDHKENKKLNITYLDYANSFSQDENLQWFNKPPSLWTGPLLPSETLVSTLMPGVDYEGDYEINKEGGQSHWVFSKERTNIIAKTT